VTISFIELAKRFICHPNEKILFCYHLC